MRKTLTALSAFFLMSCVGTPKKAIPFNADWDFCEVDGEIRACLKMEDVKKLRETLIRGGCQ